MCSLGDEDGHKRLAASLENAEKIRIRLQALAINLHDIEAHLDECSRQIDDQLKYASLLEKYTHTSEYIEYRRTMDMVAFLRKTERILETAKAITESHIHNRFIDMVHDYSHLNMKLTGDDIVCAMHTADEKYNNGEDKE